MSAGVGPEPGLLRGRRSTGSSHPSRAGRAPGGERDEGLPLPCPRPESRISCRAGLAHGTGADGPTGSSRDRSSCGPWGTGDRTAVGPVPVQQETRSPSQSTPGPSAVVSPRCGPTPGLGSASRLVPTHSLEGEQTARARCTVASGWVSHGRRHATGQPRRRRPTVAASLVFSLSRGLTWEFPKTSRAFNG